VAANGQNNLMSGNNSHAFWIPNAGGGNLQAGHNRFSLLQGHIGDDSIDGRVDPREGEAHLQFPDQCCDFIDSGTGYLQLRAVFFLQFAQDGRCRFRQVFRPVHRIRCGVFLFFEGKLSLVGDPGVVGIRLSFFDPLRIFTFL
jgi:hypothetical protein